MGHYPSRRFQRVAGDHRPHLHSVQCSGRTVRGHLFGRRRLHPALFPHCTSPLQTGVGRAGTELRHWSLEFLLQCHAVPQRPGQVPPADHPAKHPHSEHRGLHFHFFHRRDELGGKAVDVLVGEQATAIREAVVTLGTMVVGSVAATWVSVTTSFHLVNDAGEEFLNLQKQLDSVYPGCLTAAVVIFCWWLMAKKKVSPVITMLILVAVAFVGVLVGFFNPGLQY